MPKKIWLISLSICLFLLFVLFSYLVHEDLFTQLDFNTTIRLQDNLSRRFDGFFSLFSDIGSFEPVIILLLVIVALRRKIIAGVGTIFLFGLFHIFELFGKIFVDHLPPPQFMLRTQDQVDFPQFHVRSEFSYPSGHSGRAFFIGSIFLFWIWRSKLSREIKICLSAVIFAYLIIMFVSRVYLGEHWLTDVIGGALLGLSFGIGSAILFEINLFKKRSHSTKQ